MPSPDDEGEYWWFKLIDRLKNDPGINGMIVFSFIVECGKELHRDGKWDAMAINQTLLALAMDELNDTNAPITNQVRIIEHWWDGIGSWKA